MISPAKEYALGEDVLTFFRRLAERQNDSRSNGGGRNSMISPAKDGHRSRRC